MPKSHLAPGTPTVAEREASAARSVLPIGAESGGRFAVWYVVRIEGNTAVARFPFNMRADAERYAATVGGAYVLAGRASVPPSPQANPPAVPSAYRRSEPPASVRVLRTGEKPRSIPCDNRQDAITLAERIAQNTLAQWGGILTRNGDTLTVEWKYLPGGVDGTGRRFAERLAGYATVTVCERDEQPAAPAPAPVAPESIVLTKNPVPAVLSQVWVNLHWRTRKETGRSDPAETSYADRALALAVAEQLATDAMNRTGGKMSRKDDTWMVEYGFLGDTVYVVSVK